MDKLSKLLTTLAQKLLAWVKREAVEAGHRDIWDKADTTQKDVEKL